LKRAPKENKDQKFYVRSDRLLEVTVQKMAYRTKYKYLTKYESILNQFVSLQKTFSETQTTAQGPIVKPTQKTNAAQKD
jgi:hypothetical protein